MDTLLSFPVLDVIAGFIVVLIALFVAMTVIAWQQYKRANRLAAELRDSEFGKRVWADLARKHLQQLVDLRQQHATRPNENN